MSMAVARSSTGQRLATAQALPDAIIAVAIESTSSGRPATETCALAGGNDDKRVATPPSAVRSVAASGPEASRTAASLASKMPPPCVAREVQVRRVADVSA